MDNIRKDYYNFNGIQRDVNPVLSKDSDLQLSINFTSRKFGAKEGRMGYTTFLDQVDTHPVRNLIYYNLPAETGVFRVSNFHIYKSTAFSGSWGSNLQSLTADVVLGNDILGGSKPWVHLSNSTDGYYTYNGSSFVHWTQSFTPKASFLAAWQSRIFADVNKLSLAESAISFDLNTGYTTDPFTLNGNDPAGGGTVTINSGKDGSIVGITSSIDRVQIYKQLGIYRYNGNTFMKLPFMGNILAVCSTKNNVDYVLATNGIYRNDGNQVAQADFGIQSIIQETISAHGITNPVAYSFGNYTIFFIGTIRVGQGDKAIDISNGCLVHHELYDQWDIWSLGHQMTAFGFYVDPTTNEPILISGDVSGNTYKWGSQYYSDAGIPIYYHLRSNYHHMGSPTSSKIIDRYAVSTLFAESLQIAAATDYTDEYVTQDFDSDMLVKDWFNDLRDFKTISIEVLGQTKSARPQFFGYTINYKDNEERVDRPQSRK